MLNTLMVVATRPRKIECPAVEIIVVAPVVSPQIAQENPGCVVRRATGRGVAIV